MTRQRIVRQIKDWFGATGAPAQAVVFFAALLVASMPLSPFLMAISMWGLVFVAFWQQARVRLQEAPVPAGALVWAVLKDSFQRLFRQPAYAVFLLLLFIPALSGLWSDDTGYWLERVRVRLPFLVLPWAFANLPSLTQRQFQGVLYFLVWLMVVLCVGVGVNFLLHQPEIMQAMREGRPMPVPRHHIRFSLMVATAVLAGGWLWRRHYVWRYPAERPALGAATLFLFGFVHFLSVRSGLAALYVAVLLSLAGYVWRTRRWGLALGVLAMLATIPWTAVKIFPSLKQKLEYTEYDWSRYRENEGEAYSDSERWISLKTGWQIWRQHPWLGAGAGDLPAETNRILAQQFPNYQKTPKLPHNQFLYILAGTGLLGLAGSLFAFLWPVFSGRRYRDYLLSTFQAMIFTSFLVEYTIETAMGVAWYLFYTLWFLNACKQRSPTDNIS